MKQKIPLPDAKALADKIIERLKPYCQRIEIAGSIRRQKPEVGDIEIVAIPIFTFDMFGKQLTDGDTQLDLVDWQSLGYVEKNGHKYKKLILNEGIGLDLFIVTPPAQWGVIFMIRTGSAEFSERLVTKKQFGGLLPSNYHTAQGAIWRSEQMIETPEEQDVFDLLGIPFIEPQNRTE